MEEKSLGSLAEAHRHFAVHLHGLTWDLLEKADRTDFESSLMLHAAHASLYHWLQIGNQVNHQRGEWLIGRVQAVLGRSGEALRHARLTLELTQAHSGLMEDFDFAFAYEGMARACALAGDRQQADQWLARAREAGRAIKDPDDRRVFTNELEGGEWYGFDPG